MIYTHALNNTIKMGKHLYNSLNLNRISCQFFLVFQAKIEKSLAIKVIKLEEVKKD